MPVGLRPAVGENLHRPGATVFGIDGNDDALAAEAVGGFGDDVGVCHGSRVERHLVRPCQQQRPHVLMVLMGRTPPPTVSGMKHCSAVRVTRSNIVPRFSCVAWMSRKHNSSAPAAVIGARGLDRVAGIDQVDEVHPLTTRPSATSRQGMMRVFSMKTGLLPGSLRDSLRSG